MSRLLPTCLLHISRSHCIALHICFRTHVFALSFLEDEDVLVAAVKLASASPLSVAQSRVTGMASTISIVAQRGFPRCSSSFSRLSLSVPHILIPLFYMLAP